MLRIALMSFIFLESLSFGANQIYVRGTHNDWSSQEMLCSYRYGLYCKTVVTFNDKAALKFDVHGDWTENYGAGFSDECTDRAECQGRLYEDAANIELQPQTTYLIEANIWGTSHYSTTEIPTPPEELAEGEHIQKRFLVSTSGGYGSKSASVQVLVRDTAENKQVGVRFRFYHSDEWHYAYGLPTGLDAKPGHEIWEVKFSGYGEGEYELFYEELDAEGRLVNTYWDANFYRTQDDY